MNAPAEIPGFVINSAAAVSNWFDIQNIKDWKLGDVQARQDWQPMDTAPKDGTEVLLYGDWAGEINGPANEPTVMVGSYKAGSTDHAGYDWPVNVTDAYSVWCKPIAWMHKPLPPT